MSEPDGLPTPRRYWSMLAIALAIVLSVLDGTIANVALPTIAEGLRADPADAVWVVNAYQIAVMIALLPLASLGDIVGYRRVYQGGMMVFTLASLACALSDSLTTLIVARVVQGLGAAGIMSVSGALVRYTYPHALLGRAVGINAFVVALSSALGPTVASAILAVASWPWLFGISVPIGVITLLIASRALPSSPRAARKFDLLAALLNALAFGLLIGGADALAHGASVWAVLQILGGLLAAVVLVRRERSVAAPLIPLDLLRIRLFALSVATSVCSFASQMLAFVALPFHLQSAMGRSAVETGLLMTPWPLAVSVVAPIAGRLADRVSAGVLGGIGLMLLAVGLGLLAALSHDAPDSSIVWRMAVCGIGFGLFQAPNNRAMLGAAPRPRSGAAGGMLATARLLGQTAGATAVAMLFRMRPSQATSLALWAAACVAIAAALVSLLRLTDSRHAPARR